MKIIFRGLIIVIIDFILIWFLVKQMNPDPSVTIAILILVPLVFVANLIIAGIFYFINKDFIKLFIINSVISSIIMYFLFINGINKRQQQILESWKFSKVDTTFLLIGWKQTNKFSITYSIDQGSSWSVLDGTYIFKDGEFILITASTSYKVKGGYLIGFRKSTDTIKLEKINN